MNRLKPKLKLITTLLRWAASLLPGGDDLSWLTLARGVTLANLLEGLDANFQVRKYSVWGNT